MASTTGPDCRLSGEDGLFRLDPQSRALNRRVEIEHVRGS